MAVDDAADKADLAERFRQGDEACLDDVLRDICPQIQRALTRKYHGFIACDEAEHITLAALARAWERRARYDPVRGTLEGWLWTIADHLAADYLRSPNNRSRGLETPMPQARLERFVDGRDDCAGGDGLRSANSQFTKVVWECLAALPARQRFVLIADANSLNGNVASGQLSLELGISASAVRWLRSRGRRGFAVEARLRGMEEILGARHAPSVYVDRGAARGADTGNGERGTGNGERGTGNGERGTGNDRSVLRWLSQGVGFSRRRHGWPESNERPDWWRMRRYAFVNRRRECGFGAEPVVRAAIGAVLVAAALAKIIFPADDSSAGGALLNSRSVQFAVAEIEIVMGGWFWFVGFRPAWTRAVAAGCFSLFTVVAAYEAVAGHASCGCFGSVTVSPFFSLAADGCALFALVGDRLVGLNRSAPLQSRFGPRNVAALAALAFVAVPIYRHFAPPEFPGAIVVVEPEKWVGQRLPLLPYIDVAERLKHGNWLMVLHRHDCDECRDLLSSYERSGHRDPCGTDNGCARQVVFVEIPPYGAPSPAPPSGSLAGRLIAAKHWLVTPPIEIALDDGIVIGVLPGAGSTAQASAVDPLQNLLSAASANVQSLNYLAPNGGKQPLSDNFIADK